MSTPQEASTLGTYQAAVHAAIVEMARADIPSRIWSHDHTVWKPDPAEITNRLGWLDVAERMRAYVTDLEDFAKAAAADGITHALLLGMGGSSLAPEVFTRTFGVSDGHLELSVLDSTDPRAVLSVAERLDPARTLYIVSTKSGGTVETLSFFRYFYNRAVDSLGRERASRHFIAITDAGSGLDRLASAHHFRKAFHADPNIGGRYSALSHFGLVPASLIGVDLRRLIARTMAASEACSTDIPVEENLGVWLGAAISELARAGRDKLTFVISPEVAGFGDWVEQLIAESTGKQGTGILPVVGEPLGAPQDYGRDRAFVHLRLGEDTAHDAALSALEQAEHPVIRLRLADTYDIGLQFFLWEFATAVAGHRLGIQPFDQPNVESAKVRGRALVKEFSATGMLPQQRPALTDGPVGVYGDVSARTAGQALLEFLKHAQPGAYIAIQAYIQPGPDVDAALQDLRLALRSRTGLAVTTGYGPRFLHSTGQIHKGDAGRGLFVQLTANMRRDAPIPDEIGSSISTITFGILKTSQALGDAQALQEAGRQVLRFHLGSDVPSALARIIETLG